MNKLRNLFQQAANAGAPPKFMAPLPDSTNRRAAILHGGALLSFAIPDGPIGWFNVQPKKNKSVTIEESASASDVIDYLDVLPAFDVLPLFPVAQTNWLVVPVNAGAEVVRGWPRGEPRVMTLCVGEIDPLSVVRARQAAGWLLFDQTLSRWSNTAHHLRQLLTENAPECVDGFPQIRSVNYREAAQVIASRLSAARAETLLRLEAERQAAESAARLRAQQERIALAEARRREALEREAQFQQHVIGELNFLGASLTTLREQGENLEVAYVFRGMPHTVKIKKNLGGVSAGICLNGTDSEHSLTSLILAVERGRDLHRFDIDRQYWTNE